MLRLTAAWLRRNTGCCAKTKAANPEVRVTWSDTTNTTVSANTSVKRTSGRDQAISAHRKLLEDFQMEIDILKEAFVVAVSFIVAAKDLDIDLHLEVL